MGKEMIMISKEELGVLLYNDKCWELQCEEDSYYGVVGIEKYANELGVSSAEELRNQLVAKYLLERN